MKNRLFKLPFFSQPLAEHERHAKYKLNFLGSVFLLAAVVAFGMGFYRWQFSPVMGAIDFTLSGMSIVLLSYLRRHSEKVEMVSSIALTLCFVLFTAIYLLASYNPMRMSLFFLLAAAAFFLKGRQVGLRWLLLILFVIVAGHWLPGFQTGYSAVDLFTSCLYLVALFVIFWNYETVREQQQQREQGHELQSRIDERWRLALEGVGDAAWDWRIGENIFNYSASYVAILGYDEAEVGHTFDGIESLLHPEDRELAKARLQAYLTSEAAGQYVSEFRLRCKDGSYKWILCRGRVVERDAEGRPQRMLGTHGDITERKQIQEELLHSRQALSEERALFQAILDHAPLGIWMVDDKGKVKFVNQVFCHNLGISEARFLSANCYADVLPADISANCMRSDQETMAQEHPHISSEWLEFVDGRDHLLEISKVRLLNQDGSIRGVIGLATDATQRREHERQLEHIAHYDALTGVPNRVLLADRLSQALARAKREHGLMAICYLDLDGFKPVNDNYGHEAGDRVLVEITRRIKEVIREDDTVARLGGDEFVVLLVGMDAPEECVGSLNRLLEAINQPIEVLGHVVKVSASIGVSLYPEDDQDADTLLRHADQAMYLAKQSGKNRYHLYDAANDLRARSHHALLQQIKYGLQHGEFELYYQPKVELRTRQLVGVEALIRWHHPQRGLLLPGEFMRLVENTELEIVLGEWVIDSALTQMGQWQQFGVEIAVSINISAYHLQSADFVVKLQSRMQQCGASHCLQIEVLETAALEDIARVSAIIKACRAFGVGFALDDFGTGYSSLTYLSQLDVDTLKIDQSFVRDMLHEKGEHAIVLGIIALAHAFERSIVAEGVESEAHYQALLEIGCEVGQGNFIAPAMNATELLSWRQAIPV